MFLAFLVIIHTGMKDKERMSYMGKYCISCGTELPTAAKFCNQCGKSQIEELNINKSQEVQSRKNGHDSKSHKDSRPLLRGK